ncbi:RNA-directed DNA polymerase, eukaryota [Tanacetum coccineum]
MSGAHTQKNSNFTKLQDVSESVFITNFPPSFGSKDLRNACEKHGSVVDVYIAQKLSKNGRRFAFVRFVKVKNTESLLVALNKIWSGSYHLFAAKARFERKPNASSKPPSKPNHTNNQPNPASKTSQANPNCSYVSALKGISKEQSPIEILRSVSLEDSDLIDIGDTRNVVLVKARDVHLTLNINKVLRKEGFSDFHAKYIGGMWLWLEFDSVESCTKLQSNKEMAWYFTQIKHVSESFKIDERVVWIEIGGLPLNAWTPTAFKKIASSWGEPLFVDDDPSESVATGRVCIRSKIHGHIKETCKVMIKGKVHYVRVKEFAGWVPDMEAGDGDSEKNSDADSEENGINTGEHDDLDANFVGVQDALDVEEGEIPAKDVAETEEVKNSQSVKSSRISKPVSKAFSNHGSMIEALVTQIEMGKVLGYDMQAGKCKAISKLCNKHNINFLGIQETHSSSIDSFKVKSMWGNFRFDFAFCPSVGRSGGILSIWDTNVFSKINVHPFDHFLIVEGKWVNENFQCFMVNVYAPQEDRNKVALWNSILEFKENHPGHYVVFGDFNAVRYASERIGTLFNSSSAYAFNQFIANGTLWEFPNGGHLFTRINRRGDKLSKLDRFFITEALYPTFAFRGLIQLCDLCTIISDFWSLNTFYGSNAIVAFKNKLKALKRIIKEWAKNRKSAISKQKDEILLLLKKFDEDTLINDGST